LCVKLELIVKKKTKYSWGWNQKINNWVSQIKFEFEKF
jgi:hypothetical protein